MSVSEAVDQKQKRELWKIRHLMGTLRVAVDAAKRDRDAVFDMERDAARTREAQADLWESAMFLEDRIQAAEDTWRFLRIEITLAQEYLESEESKRWLSEDQVKQAHVARECERLLWEIRSCKLAVSAVVKEADKKVQYLLEKEMAQEEGCEE